MEKRFFLCVMLMLSSLGLWAQSDSVQMAAPARKWNVRSAIEVESLVPMFMTGGFHVGIGYRFDKFRVRFSVINGGSYDAEKAGINNSSNDYKRFYKTSPGLFFGYNVWRNLELYSYLELHTFEIEQRSTGIRKNLFSTDTGLGLSYQFFIGDVFYIQPGLHLYLRKRNSIDFETARYTIPGADFSPVLRLGARLWSKSK